MGIKVRLVEKKCDAKKVMDTYNRLLKKDGYVMVQQDDILFSVDEIAVEDGKVYMEGMDQYDDDYAIDFCDGWEFADA